MKISSTQLRQIIIEELTNILQESDLPDFVKRKKSYDFEMPDFTKKKKSGMPDFTKRKKEDDDLPDFKKRPKKVATPKDILQNKFGIGPAAFKAGASMVIQTYYKLRSNSMARENPAYGKLPDGFSNPKYTIDADQDFLDLVAKLSGNSEIAGLPLPYEEVDIYDNEWGHKLVHMGHKSTEDLELIDRIAYLWLNDGEIQAVFFGRGW